MWYGVFTLKQTSRHIAHIKGGQCAIYYRYCDKLCHLRENDVGREKWKEDVIRKKQCERKIEKEGERDEEREKGKGGIERDA